MGYIEIACNMAAKLHLLQLEHTRQAITNSKRSELQVVPIYTENKYIFAFFSATKTSFRQCNIPYIGISTQRKQHNIFRLVDGDNVLFHRAPGFAVI